MTHAIDPLGIYRLLLQSSLVTLLTPYLPKVEKQHAQPPPFSCGTLKTLHQPLISLLSPQLSHVVNFHRAQAERSAHKIAATVKRGGLKRNTAYKRGNNFHRGRAGSLRSVWRTMEYSGASLKGRMDTPMHRRIKEMPHFQIYLGQHHHRGDPKQ